MKKRIWILAFVLVIMFCFTACGKDAEPQPSSEDPQEEIQDSDEEEDSKEEDQDDGSDEDLTEDGQENEQADTDVEEPAAAPVSITVFYGNDDATGFDSEEVQIAALSPEEVLKALTDKSVLPGDVQVLSLENSVVDGKQSIELDLNDAFLSHLSSAGSTGEYYVMGSVCNTFLEAYGCEQIRITVNGRELATGHTEYPGYMTAFSRE